MGPLNRMHSKHNFRLFDLNEHSPNALEVKDLSLAYRKRLALKDIHTNLKLGSLTALIGPNGGGKSSFLKALLGLLPTHGQIQFQSSLKSTIAYLPQKNDLDTFFPLSVYDVVASGHCQKNGFFKAFSKEQSRQIHQALEEVGLTDCADRTLNALSGGQLQRVLFARATVQNADLILLDEPFTAVDSYTTDALIHMILKWSKLGKTILVVCHDLDLVEEFFPQTILLAQKIIAQGPTAEVITKENIKTAKRIAQDLEHTEPVPPLPEVLTREVENV